MTRFRSSVILPLASAALTIGLPLLGAWVRRDSPPRCAFDGLEIDPVYRVMVIRGRDTHNEFCCVQCAVRWLEKPGTIGSEILVTDESSGQLINADEAWFVRSSVPTNRLNRNRLHVFRLRADAERHANAFHGEILMVSDRPFSKPRPD